MKPILLAVLILGLVVPAFSAGTDVVFDGNIKTVGKIADHINDPAVLSAFGGNELISPLKTTSTGVAAMRLFEIKASGSREIVNPVTISDSKTSYEFTPNAYRYWELTCTGQNAGPWGACWSVDFHPAAAGHNHSPARTLSYIDPQNDPQLLPARICKSDIPGNTPFKIYFKAPAYSALVLEKSEFYGSCQGTMQTENFIKVTAQNSIQLEELKPEPYFTFKSADGHHSANRFAAADTNIKLKQIAWEYYSVYKPATAYKMITINDMGLIWGGRYHALEPHNCWANGADHVYHRYGRQVDVRSWNIPRANRACFKEIACKHHAHPILEGSAPGAIPEKDYSNISSLKADILDRMEHYHLNFAGPADPQVDPIDDTRTTCPSVIPPEVSACPKPRE